MVALLVLPRAPLAQSTEEYAVKAAFIYNFFKFVSWPPERPTDAGSLDICVVGNSDIIEAAPIFRQASTPKLNYALRKEANLKNLSGACHVVFIGQDEAGNLPDILAAIRGKPILTVSDMEDFAVRGGMIGFVMISNKIKLEINPKAAGASGLRIDAQLLETAVKVVDR